MDEDEFVSTAKREAEERYPDNGYDDFLTGNQLGFVEGAEWALEYLRAMRLGSDDE